VPSQSKAAIRGSRRRTVSRNSWLEIEGAEDRGLSMFFDNNVGRRECAIGITQFQIEDFRLQIGRVFKSEI